MDSFPLTNTIWQNRCDRKIEKVKKEYNSKIELCEKRLKRVGDDYKQMNILKNNRELIRKENSPQSRTYDEYEKKINRGSPIMIGGRTRRYRNVEYQKHRGHQTIRRVNIVGGRGHKSVTIQDGGGKKRTAKKALTKDEMEKICSRKFIHGLFDDCVEKLK